jgi:hypothetical protein
VQRVLAYLLVLFFLSGCREVPRGASFEKKGWILTDEKLELPWVAMSPGKHKWCFARLGFTASSPQVLLEVRAEAPFDPRRVGGIASLDITNPSGQSIYRVEGPLEDPCCQAANDKNDTWVSEYYHTSYGPPKDTETFYQDSARLHATIGNLGEYCVSLDVSSPPPTVVRPKARVVLQSGWK